jgi:hypothetical protein
VRLGDEKSRVLDPDAGGLGYRRRELVPRALFLGPEKKGKELVPDLVLA